MTHTVHDETEMRGDVDPQTGTLARMYRPTLVATGVVLAVSSLISALSDPGDGPAEVAYAQTTTHLVSGVVGLVSFALVAFSVVLLQLHQRGGPKSTVAMVLAFFFAVAAAGGEFASTVLEPFIAQVAPAVYGGDSAPPLIGLGFSIAFVGVGLFVGVYGIVLAVMGRVPRVGAILIALGALAAGAPGDYGDWFALLIAVGFVWIALAPSRGTRPAATPAATDRAPATG